jgi:hypothetical protein
MLFNNSNNNSNNSTMISKKLPNIISNDSNEKYYSIHKKNHGINRNKHNNIHNITANVIPILDNTSTLNSSMIASTTFSSHHFIKSNLSTEKLKTTGGGNFSVATKAAQVKKIKSATMRSHYNNLLNSYNIKKNVNLNQLTTETY